LKSTDIVDAKLIDVGVMYNILIYIILPKLRLFEKTKHNL